MGMEGGPDRVWERSRDCYGQILFPFQSCRAWHGFPCFCASSVGVTDPRTQWGCQYSPTPRSPPADALARQILPFSELLYYIVPGQFKNWLPAFKAK